ncbi:MAG: DUF2997 domain-containing protein [Candidatus Helarchaeota archaeon]
MDKDKKIIIEIDKDGRITADAIGFKGEICLEILKKLLEDLPLIKNIDKKSDFYEGEDQVKIDEKIKISSK